MASVDSMSTDQIRHCIEANSSHPLLEVDYLCVGANVDHLDDSTLEILGGKKHKINLDENFTGHGEIKNLDYVVLDKVLNKKKNPGEFLEACKHLIREDGFLLVVEVTSQYEIALSIEALLGSEIAEEKSRRYNQFFTHEQLLEMFGKTGFRLCNYQSDPSLMTTMYIIRRIPSIPRHPTYIDVDDIKEFSWIEPLQKTVEEKLNKPDSETIWLVSNKVSSMILGHEKFGL